MSVKKIALAVAAIVVIGVIVTAVTGILPNFIDGIFDSLNDWFSKIGDFA